MAVSPRLTSPTGSSRSSPQRKRLFPQNGLGDRLAGFFKGAGQLGNRVDVWQWLSKLKGHAHFRTPAQPTEHQASLAYQPPPLRRALGLRFGQALPSPAPPAPATHRSPGEVRPSGSTLRAFYSLPLRRGLTPALSMCPIALSRSAIASSS